MKRAYYVVDFETTLDSPTRVWAYAITNIETLKVENYGTNIEDFLKFISSKNCLIYFHNLKFDGQFILHWLLKNNFKHTEKVKYPKEFSTLIDGMGAFYSLCIKFKKSYNVKIYDSLKLLPFPVKVIGKSFGLDYKKGEIDFDECKKDNYVLNDERLEYVIDDTRVVAQALKLCFIDKGYNKMTIGGNALNLYKSSFCPSKFEYLFPQLEKHVDDFCRLAYKGGYCYVNPKYENKWVENGSVYDVNSLYPYAMTMLLPYGLPVYFSGKYEKDVNFPLYIIQFSCMFELKDGYVPTIQLKRNLGYVPTEYISKVTQEVILTMTSVEFEMFIEHYDVYCINYIGGFKFQAKRGLFDDYINYFYEGKKIHTGAQRQSDKLFLNNLYGKFSTSPRNIKKIPYLEDNVVKFKIEVGEDKETVYLPCGAFITANAKVYTIKHIMKNIDRFLYCDTDSIHILGLENPNNTWVDSSELGAWKKEVEFKKAKFIKPKTYVEVDFNDNISVKCCGMPQNIKDDFEKKIIPLDEFSIGFTSCKKLIPKRVDGGVILEKTPFTIN